MKFLKSKVLLVIAVLSLSSMNLVAQKVDEPKPFNADWTKSYPAFRIAGNLYYVGTYDLASYLITTSQGNILINTGLAASRDDIKKNIESLGFKYKDLKILLTTQAHYDHMGAMAAVKNETGAKFYVDKGDATASETGGKADYEMGKYGVTFKPIKADRLLNDGDIIKLGDTQLVMLHHPGHTKGSCSYMLTVRDGATSYKVLIANMPTIINDRPFDEITDYPAIEKEFGSTIQKMKALDFDLWVASHASQFNLHEKRKPGDAYNPKIFADKKAYLESLDKLQKAYDEKRKEGASK